MDEISIGSQEQKTQPTSKSAGAIVAIIFIIIFVAIIIGVLAGTSGSSSSSYLTYSNYQKIYTGMSYREVVSVLGNDEGELTSSAGYGGYTLEYYTWSNNSGTKCIVIGFENGRVCAKTQYGLG